MGESRVLTPSGHVGEFTEPRAHSFAQLCIFFALLATSSSRKQWLPKVLTRTHAPRQEVIASIFLPTN